VKIVVFGASGFVGGWICELLHQRCDIELLACLRRWGGATRVARRGIEMMQVDLDSFVDLSELVRGADAVINASVPPSDREPELAFRLYMACRRAGVLRFVQFSSAALYGDLTGDVNEDLQPAPVDDYGRGKAEMETRLRSAAVRGGTQLFILRPSIIYGPYSDAWTVRYARRIVLGHWRGLGSLGDGMCNLVYARDVSQAAILCATQEASSESQVLNINGPDVVTWNEYIERFGDALGIEDRDTPNNIKLLAMVIGTETVRRVGKWLLVHFERSVRKLTQSGKNGPAVMAGAKAMSELYPALSEISLLRRKVRYNWDRATKEIDFRPEVSLNDGLRQSANWCHTHGVV
jgi:nucleoside-diphosphate-sugar epimerase